METQQRRWQQLMKSFVFKTVPLAGMETPYLGVTQTLTGLTFLKQFPLRGWKLLVCTECFRMSQNCF